MVKTLLAGVFTTMLIIFAVNPGFAQMENYSSPDPAIGATSVNTTTPGSIATGTNIIRIYNNPTIVDPTAISVKTGETLNLAVENHSGDTIKFEVPSMRISVEVPKDSSVVIPISFVNPIDDELFYRVNLTGGNNIPGRFIVTDYVKGPTGIAVTPIDTTQLEPIINYSTAYDYPDKPEPVYSEITQQVQPQVEVKKPSYVRGYW